MAVTLESLISNETSPLLPIIEPQPQYARQTYNSLPIPPTISKNDFYSVLTNWSGTGQRFDVQYSSLAQPYKSQLKKGLILGQGHFGQVYKVTYRGVDLARKSIKLHGGVSEEEVKMLKEEATLGEKLDSHRHIVKLVGTYWKEDYHFNILIYPVAVCDLGQVLGDMQDWWDMDNTYRLTPTSDARKRLDRLGIGLGHLNPFDDALWDPLTRRLREIIGCTTQGILWMHSQRIYHRDLKPQNILLRQGELYLTDFGISKNGNEAQSATTELHVGHTLGYAAPEVMDQGAYNPQQADIFSLGCVFLHIWCMTKNGRRIIPRNEEAGWTQQELRVVCFREFLRDTKPRKNFGTYAGISEEMVSLLASMLSYDRKKRPGIQKVDQKLRMIKHGRLKYYGSCCRERGALDDDEGEDQRPFVVLPWRPCGEEPFKCAFPWLMVVALYFTVLVYTTALTRQEQQYDRGLVRPLWLAVLELIATYVPVIVELVFFMCYFLCRRTAYF